MAAVRAGKPAQALKGLKILVVEDDSIIRLDIEHTLRAAGAETVGCGSVEEALTVVANNWPELAILDVRLGRETVAPVARALASRGVPFVFYTGQVGPDPALAEWPDRKVLAKPAQPAIIVATMAGLAAR